MKYRLYYIILIFAHLACSKVEEVRMEENWEFLTIEKIQHETHLPIIHLEVHAELFDSMNTLYHDKIEIPAGLSLIRNNNEILLNEPCSIEVKGNFNAQFSLKSYEITFDNAVENTDRNVLNPEKNLEHHSLDKLKAVRIRNSGNDFNKTIFKDLLYTKIAIASGLDIDLMYGEQVVVFVNQSFYGIMNLRTESNSKGISRLYNTTADHISMAKIDNKGTITFQNGNYNRLDEYVTNIKNKNLIYVKENTDLPHFVDYIIFQTFIANYDWPYNNVRFYCIDNGKFRFVMYDLDWCNTMHLEKDADFFINSEYPNLITELFNLLITDIHFNQLYYQRLNEIKNLETLLPENFNEEADKLKMNIEPIIHYQIQKHAAPSSKIIWRQEIELLKAHYKKRYKNFF